MTEQEARECWVPARDKLRTFSDEKYDGSRKLASLLGMPYPQMDHYKTISLTEDLKRILILLGGPHHHAIVKILEVRNQCKNQTDHQLNQSTASLES
jgi:hypothetical protein